MTSAELRQKYLDFFRSKGHTVIPSASLVPENDPSVLFTTAGMHPLVPYLLGEAHPAGKRLTSVQKCVRTGDIDEVGDEVHLTFFEMLGNWSLGDYWKQEAIEWSFEFLTKELGLPIEKLAVSCFAGDADAPRDEESAAIWASLGIPTERIYFFGKADNWWGPAGQTGPCGPDTEMFYWTGEGEPEPLATGDNKEKWVEIWNDVFMQYSKTKEGKFVPLTQKNVDTGMGLERTTAVVNGTDIYQTDAFKTPFKELFFFGGNEKDKLKSVRIIADHVRAATFLFSDAVVPSNKERGYVLRRLIRRSVVHARKMFVPTKKLVDWVKNVIEFYRSAYPELANNAVFIIEGFEAEIGKFEATLERGMHEFDKRYPGPQVQALKRGEQYKPFVVWRPVGAEAFDLYQTYGFPKQVIKELLEERLYKFNESEFDAKFDEEMKKHQELSRTASAGQFKGGLTDHSDVVVRLHTATHLMNAALRQVLGDHVWQKGSNITAERTRFDFSHEKKLTDEEKQKVEELVNGWVARDLPVEKKILPLVEARKLGAVGVFGEKYPDTVSVYTVLDPATGEIVSREFCGGPHVTHTGEIGKFRILKEEASSAGVRRIKAVVGE